MWLRRFDTHQKNLSDIMPRSRTSCNFQTISFPDAIKDRDSSVRVTDDGMLIAQDFASVLLGKDKGEAGHVLNRIFEQGTLKERVFPGAGNYRVKLLSFDEAIDLAMNPKCAKLSTETRKQIAHSIQMYKAGFKSFFKDIAPSIIKQKEKAMLRFPKQSFVYAVHSDSFPGVVKIGMTSNLKARLTSLNCSMPMNPYKLVTRFSTYKPSNDEAEAHMHFSQYKAAKEHFAVPIDVVKSYFSEKNLQHIEKCIATKELVRFYRIFMDWKTHSKAQKMPSSRLLGNSPEDAQTYSETTAATSTGMDRSFKKRKVTQQQREAKSRLGQSTFSMGNSTEIPFYDLKLPQSLSSEEFRKTLLYLPEVNKKLEEYNVLFSKFCDDKERFCNLERARLTINRENLKLEQEEHRLKLEKIKLKRMKMSYDTSDEDFNFLGTASNVEQMDKDAPTPTIPNLHNTGTVSDKSDYITVRQVYENNKEQFPLPPDMVDEFLERAEIYAAQLYKEQHGVEPPLENALLERSNQ